jgi:hypothetical protein
LIINVALNILSSEHKSRNVKAKGKKVIKAIKYKLSVRKNKLILKKKYKFKDLKCKEKNGLIYFISSRPFAPKYKITVLPVFISITPSKLILTKDVKHSIILQSISLVDIQRIDQHYLGTFCFDIILNQIVDNRLEAGQLSLCAKNEKEMNKWVNSVLEFKKCSLKGSKRIDHNGKLVLDLEKINEYTRNRTLTKDYELHDLFYDADNTAFTVNHEKINKIKKSLDSISTLASKGDIAVTQIHRQYKGRLIQAKQFKNQIKHRVFNMRMSHTNQIIIEKEKEAKLEHKKVAKKELRLIKSAAKQISKFKHMELLQYKSLYEHQINIQKQQAINRSKHMMRIIKQESKLTNFAQCYQPELEGFRNMGLVQRMCKHLYGLFVFIYFNISHLKFV